MGRPSHKYRTGSWGWGLAIWTVLIGPNKAKEMMMLGSTISAEMADQLGLINHVVNDDQVMATASEIALQLCMASSSFKRYKISVNNWLKSQFASLFEVSLAAELESMRHADFSEGVNAALEKRNRNSTSCPLRVNLFLCSVSACR